MTGGELFFVALTDRDRERVLGFSSYRLLDGKHRTAVYVRCEAARMGIGTALFLAAEGAAREHGAVEIHVSASLAAVQFYKDRGFEKLAAGEHRLSGGVLMACVFMKKRLHNPISFRPLERSDFRLLQEWLAAPHVAAWWNEHPDPASVEAKYGPRIDGAEPTHMFMVEYEGRPIGWIQWYLWADYPEHARKLGAEPHSAGIDLAIGDAEMTGLGLGPVTIREFLKQFVFTNPAVCAVITDPDESNLRSVRAFEKAGFKVVKTVQPDGERSKRQIVRLDRP
jgi:aminoglycoside 6'-N-acetyltransferase